jgi:predicted Zn-dependent protease
LAKPIAEISEEVLKGLATPQAVLAAVCVIAFWLTLVKAGSSGAPPTGGPNDLSLNSAQVLLDVQNMEPSKLAAEGNIDDAVSEAGRELNERPNDLRTVMCAGNMLSQYGDKEKGLQLLKKSLDLAPQSRYVRLNCARQLAACNRMEESIAQYLILCRTYPKQYEPHFEIANVYMNSHKPNLAAEQYKIILDGNPGQTLVRKNYGLALSASGSAKEGFDNFIQACGVGKDEASYASVAKTVLQNNGNSVKKALGDMKIEVATKPKQMGPRITFAQLLLYLGRYDEAKDVALEAIKLDSSNPELYMVLAEANLKLDEKEEAKKAFSKAASALSASRS